MFAKLSALAFGGPSFPYKVDEAYPSAWGEWAHHKGTSNEDGAAVSIFKITAADPNDRKLVVARNGVKRLKMLRHPNILAFKESYETTEKGMSVLYMVTQPVQPLMMVLKELNLEGQHRDSYLAMCILHMTNAVSFLNNDCKLIHGGICIDAVVVTDTLDPKLHGFDLLSELALPGDDFPLKQAAWMIGEQYKPAELGRSEWGVIRESPPWAVDAWGLGCLIQEICSCQLMKSVEDLRRTDCIPPALLGDYQKLLSSAPTRRLNPSKVAECKFLHNKLVDVVNFMQNIAVKDSVEKDSFFKRLPGILPTIPSAVAVRKILPLLSSALEFGGAPAHAVGSLMVIGNQLEGEEFMKRVVPTLTMLFASQDRSLRRSLLESMDVYAPHLTTQVIEDQIYPQLQTGFSDANAYIRELTLKSMLALAPKMSNKTLTQNVLKHLSKLQVDEEPSIRANTTVLLGNVAKYLGEATCRRVLLNAFTRALKDAFPPAKIAGLRAMVATASYHNAEDAALRILPAVAPMCIDPAGDVRSSALQCLDTFSKVLWENDDKRTREAAAAAAAVGAADSAGPAGAAPTIGAGSVMTWAMSSFMSSTGLAVKAASAPAAAAGLMAPPGGAGRVPEASQLPSSSSSATGAASRPAGSDVPAARAAVASVPASRATGSGGGGAADGWDGGLGEAWEDDEELKVDEEEVAARSRLSARPAAAASRGSTARAPPAAAAAAAAAGAGDGWGAGDEDLGGWEGMGAAPAVEPERQQVRPRPVRPAAGSGSSGGAKPARTGGMKLGAQKLGVQKLNADF